MFSFTAKGRIGCIDRPKGTDAIVRLSIAADRIVRGQTDTFTKTEWLSAVCFDAKLNADMLQTLEVGASVELQGRIEPRKREVEGKRIGDLSLVIERVQLISKPKAKNSESSTKGVAA